MVGAVRRGLSRREAGRRFGVALCTVQRWVARAKRKRLNQVDWSGRSRRPKKIHRTDAATERRVLSVRRYLKERSVLGEYGAAAIRRHMEARIKACPSARTIGRILQRHGVLDGRQRTRRPAPLRGWYLPEVAAEQAELDSFDTIEGLAIRGGPHLSVLTGVSLHGGVPVASPQRSVTSVSVVQSLVAFWQQMGLPGYAQFDNDNRFQGPHQHPDSVGRVIRLCLSLHVTPVFAPPKETGFQASIESLNARWQAKVWSRFEHRSIHQLRSRSAKYIEAARERITARIEAAPARCTFPKRWRLNLQAHPRGKIIYIRRTTDKGCASFLGRSFPVDRHWAHRLVRAEVDLAGNTIRFYALRRREPTDQPLLSEAPYRLPKKHFRE